VPYLSASAEVIQYEEALYQVYARLLEIMKCQRILEFIGRQLVT